MESTKAIIIKAATLSFSSYGPQTVSMNDVALQCGISKKTLYQFFESKEKLLLTTVEDLLYPHKQYLEKAPGVALYAESEMTALLADVADLLLPLTTVFFRGIKKQFPGVFRLLPNYWNDNLIPALKKIILKGMKQGCFKKGLEADIHVELYCRLLQNNLEGTHRFLGENPLSINPPINFSCMGYHNHA